MVAMNTNAVAAYGGGSEMSAQIQAVEALKALEQENRSGSSEAQVQDRVARRTESVILTISPEARALKAADSQRATEAPRAAAPAARTEATQVARIAEPAAIAPEVAAEVQVDLAVVVPVAAPVVQAQPDPLEQDNSITVVSTAEATQNEIETADVDAGNMAPETSEQTATEEVTDPAAVQVASPEQVDTGDDGEEPAQRAAADAATAAESTEGDASDVQPI